MNIFRTDLAAEARQLWRERFSPEAAANLADAAAEPARSAPSCRGELRSPAAAAAEPARSAPPCRGELRSPAAAAAEPARSAPSCRGELRSPAPPAAAELHGVTVTERTERGYLIERITITDLRAAETLGKPPGTYVTLSLDALSRTQPRSFTDGAELLKRLLRQLLPPMRSATAFSVLVVGLGNREITFDSLGPLTAERVIATRRLFCDAPQTAAPLTAGNYSVAVLQPGVEGATGLESAELVKAVVNLAKPDVVIAVDALSSANPERV
ncbi:MAG: GPR endopeptidase, partial [Oscillospiraceae bacterium]|nr:GPR endopeptidase [Oscillospiraceae bacterium]